MLAFLNCAGILGVVGDWEKQLNSIIGERESRHSL